MVGLFGWVRFAWHWWVGLWFGFGVYNVDGVCLWCLWCGRCSALVGFFCFACLIDLLLSRCFLDLLLVFWLCMLCW